MNRLPMLGRFVRSYFATDYYYDYWHCPHESSDRLAEGDYFIDFRPKTAYAGPFDAEGIPLLDLTSQHWAKIKTTVYSPIVISEWALGWYSRFIRGESESLRPFLLGADWLLNRLTSNVRTNSAAALWTDYGDGPVLSGMANGLAISVWVRAFRLTGRPEFEAKAFQAFRIFTIDLQQGGVVSRTLGFPVLEEWAHQPYHILNGHLFAFVGVLELLRAFPSVAGCDEVRRAYDDYLSASLKLCQRADMGFWSRYSLRNSWVPNISSYFYHQLHINMLRSLACLTGRDEFDRYANRWTAQRDRQSCRLLAMVLKLLDRAYLELRATGDGSAYASREAS